ncbi:MAG: VIT1/CCC1 transporter family protein [Actinomycetota bacterium]|nr:VIT1/CCC1 transporter family protein [Actinomycetota bacterium]
MTGTLLARVVGRVGRRAPSPDPSSGADGLPDHHHRDVRGGGLRAAVFGVSDGLVSNVSLVLGTVGAHPGAGVIRLAGLAGLFGGAFSMAVGEYVSMQAQREAFERELSIEREELRRRPEFERRELTRIYERRGIEREVAAQLATELMADPEVALETHAREELGIDPGELGAPLQAAGSSFITFALGALVPLLPFLLGAKGTAAIGITIGLSALAAVAIGSLLSVLTARPWWRSALRQLVLCALAGAATFGIGSAIGIAG